MNDARGDYRVALLLYELVKALPLLILCAAVPTFVLVTASTVLSQIDQAQRDRATLDMGSIGNALKLYRAKTGRLPSSGEGFAALVEKRALDNLPSDPWGHAYDYALNADGVVLRSRGPDGLLGGRGAADDIVVRRRQSELYPDAGR